MFDANMCPRTLHSMHVCDMGLLFGAMLLSPFLNKGRQSSLWGPDQSQKAIEI